MYHSVDCNWCAYNFEKFEKSNNYETRSKRYWYKTSATCMSSGQVAYLFTVRTICLQFVHSPYVTIFEASVCIWYMRERNRRIGYPQEHISPRNVTVSNTRVRRLTGFTGISVSNTRGIPHGNCWQWIPVITGLVYHVIPVTRERTISQNWRR